MRQRFLLVLFLCGGYLLQSQKRYYTSSATELIMGSRFEITIVDENKTAADSYVAKAIAEIRRLENIISSWKPNSETSKINNNAGIGPVKVSTELFELIKRSKSISELTDGAFDITYAALDTHWKFDGSMTHFPTDEELKGSVSKIGYDKIILDEPNQTVFLKDKGMKIGFGAIGKGFAADWVKEKFKNLGVTGGLINASGDLTTWGTQESGKKWVIGITNPMEPGKVFAWLPIDDSSIATSGDYEKFIEYQGKKYSHIIDPRTGMPTTGIKSVSIFAKSAELSDALATSVFILGREAGFYLINQLPDVEALLIDDKGEVFKTNGVTSERNTSVIVR